MNSRSLVTLGALAMIAGMLSAPRFLDAQQGLAAQGCNSEVAAMLNSPLPQAGPAAPQRVSSSTVTAPTVQLTPTSINFWRKNPPPNRQTCPPTANPQSVTLTNLGPGVLNISSMKITGPFRQTNNCGTALGTGQSCTIVVTWTTGILSFFGVNSLSIFDNGVGSPQLVHLAAFCPVIH